MEKRESMWERYLRKGMSRRSFLKGCVALTTLMGLSTDKLSEVVEAAIKKGAQGVIRLDLRKLAEEERARMRPMARRASLSVSDEYQDFLLAFPEIAKATLPKEVFGPMQAKGECSRIW